MIKDYYLFGIIGFLLFIDFAILVPWQIVDPINIEENRVPIMEVNVPISSLELLQVQSHKVSVA